MLVPGSMVSSFRVEALIGKGGMGEIYKGLDTELNRPVAIKALNPELTSDSNFIERFRQEAQIQARLIHPNIVSLFTMREEFGVYYMVMEYAHGQTLREIIANIGPIPEQRALHILSQVLDGLQFAHERGIIHRDIKPSNIIVDANDHVKILDFGIARMVGEKGLTRTGQNVGTVYYMSPEQVRADKEIDQRSDIFSLGITFFEMLCGRTPYNTDTSSDYAVMDEIVHKPLEDPRKYYQYISDIAVDLLRHMTEKDKNLRFQNCKAAHQMVWAAQSGQPLSVQAGGNLPQTHSGPYNQAYPQYDQYAASNHNMGPANQNNNSQQINPYYGIKGWLALLCIGTTIIQPIFLLVSIIGSLGSLGEINDDYVGIILLSALFDLVNMIFCIALGSSLWARKPKADRNLFNWLIIRPVLVFLLVIVGASVDGEFAAAFGTVLVQNIAFAVVWGTYLKVSKRVKATFPRT